MLVSPLGIPHHNNPRGTGPIRQPEEQSDGRVSHSLQPQVAAPSHQSGSPVRQGALAAAGVLKYTEGKQVVKVIYAPNRLVNIVVM